MPKNDEFLNTSGEACQPTDPWVAREIKYSSASRFFIKANRVTAKLFNPLMDTVSDDRFKRGKPPEFSSVEVNKDCFELYMDFLKNKNILSYNKANMYRR
jgi:hypothetical protein